MPFSEQPKLNSDKGSLKQYPEREVSEGFRALNLRSPNALLESILAVIMRSLGVKILLNQKRPKSVVALKNFRCNANDFALFKGLIVMEPPLRHFRSARARMSDLLNRMGWLVSPLVRYR